jgi:ribonuclease HI
MKVELYADGSGNTFDSDGGYGWRCVIDGSLHSEGNGYLTKATNNVAEITAAIVGLEHVFKILNTQDVLAQGPHEVVLVSDSQLVLGYASGAYQCKALHLAPLYIKLRSIYGTTKATTRWVKGHSGDEHNEGCDRLAKAARLGKGTTGLVEPKLPCSP